MGDKPNVKMAPMFLPGVANNPQPGPYADALRMMQAAGEYPQIWHLFAFKPRATDHLARFTQEIMREPAPLSPWLRELIAAYTSARNDCPF
jgi:alkylhydroperoxidase family enzyme